MATTTVQAELDEALEDISKAKRVLEEAYRPEATREDLAEAIGEALGVLDVYDTDELEDDEDESETDD